MLVISSRLPLLQSVGFADMDRPSFRVEGGGLTKIGKGGEKCCKIENNSLPVPASMGFTMLSI